jgi:hypothetical protein
MELYQAQVPNCAAIHYLLAAAYSGHETHIFRHHQGNASLAASLNNLGGSFKITGDGFFYQDVLASTGCQGYVLQVQVVRGTNVQGIYLGVGGRFSIRAVGPASLKCFGVGLRSLQVPAGEEKVDFLLQGYNTLSKGASELSTAENTESEAHDLP